MAGLQSGNKIWEDWLRTSLNTMVYLRYCMILKSEWKNSRSQIQGHKSQARIHEFSWGGVHISKNFDKQKKKRKERKRNKNEGCGGSFPLAEVIFSNRLLQTIIYIIRFSFFW